MGDKITDRMNKSFFTLNEKEPDELRVAIVERASKKNPGFDCLVDLAGSAERIAEFPCEKKSATDSLIDATSNAQRILDGLTVAGVRELDTRKIKAGKKKKQSSKTKA